MPHIDLRTVILLAGFMTALMAVVLFFVTRSFPQRIRGIGHWAGGTLVGVFSGLLFGLRGLIPDALSVLLASLLLYTALSLWLSGTELFYQRQPSWRFQALVSGVGLGLLTWFLYRNSDNGAMLDSKQLYEWAFGNLALKKVVGEQTPVCETKVNYAFNKDTLLLVPEYSYSTMVPVGDDKESVEIVPNVPESVDTPVTKGQKIGTADIKYGGQKIASVNLVASESVDRSEFVYGAAVIKNVITSPWFIGAAVLVLVLFIIYLIAVSMMGKKKKGNVKKFRDL